MTQTRRSLLRCLAAALPLIAAPLSACHPASDDAEPTDNATHLEHEAMEGRIVEFALEPGAVGHDEIQAIAAFVETLGDVKSAQVKVRAEENDATVISMELWGANFPDEDGLAAAMRGEFPFMKDAVITVAELERDGPTEIEQLAHEDEDPEVVKKRIIEDLRAKGVEGDIQVEIRDRGDGHREVEVKVDSDHPEDADKI